ncbi:MULTISPECIES: UvrD-helicase domain-containing protein [Marinobacter]|uniref:DNA 3'-5' helicase II n=1 Tax=Marinobacter vinifirmus TaxID=355591 RepID=A0A7Z1DRD8_9GAMM|nr:UvrD-helicase domain-containing protein [Marinobacter vinifirmus]OZC34536.1 DNA helicase UvrD [Marinobacter vinifirmus]WBU42597.1 UvrD-helicase domain-containing protein [Marinobacter alkaliphilus]
MPEIDLLAIDRGSVMAPAGCGKTELITEALKAHSGSKPILVLTHTNAGVAALRTRLNRAGVSSNRYRLVTIDGWALKLIKMFPSVSGHDPSITDVLNPRRDYPAIRQAASILLQRRHLWALLQASYDRVIVDEYQDCNTVQHAIVCALAQELRTCVLGDPMQAIFSFGGNVLVDWEQEVSRFFPASGELNTPWRWKNAGAEDLGHWLLFARGELLAGRAIDLRQAPSLGVEWHPLGSGNDAEVRRQAAKTTISKPGARVLVIGEATNVTGHHDCAKQTPGAVVVEAVSLNQLIGFAEDFNPGAENGLSVLAAFAQSTITGVSSVELAKRLATINSGRSRKSPSPAELEALNFQKTPSYDTAARYLEVCHTMNGTRVFRPALLFSGIESLRSAHQKGVTLKEAALQVRENYRAKGRKIPNRGVGSTLLLKGLEAEVVVILNGDQLTKQNLYVAITRGAMRVIVCSSSPILGI